MMLLKTFATEDEAKKYMRTELDDEDRRGASIVQI